MAPFPVLIPSSQNPRDHSCRWCPKTSPMGAAVVIAHGLCLAIARGRGPNDFGRFFHHRGRGATQRRHGGECHVVRGVAPLRVVKIGALRWVQNDRENGAFWDFGTCKKRFKGCKRLQNVTWHYQVMNSQSHEKSKRSAEKVTLCQEGNIVFFMWPTIRYTVHRYTPQSGMQGRLRSCCQYPYGRTGPYYIVINGVISPLIGGEITPQLPIYLRPFLRGWKNSIYNDRSGPPHSCLSSAFWKILESLCHCKDAEKKSHSMETMKVGI